MKRIVPATVVGLFTLGACTVPYSPASPDEPHAVLKLRRVYHDEPGPLLRESGLINGEYALLERTTQPLASPHTHAVLVRPEQAIVQFTSTFFHTETRQVQESYTVQQPYTDRESYSCGTSASPRTCTRSVTRYRSVTRWRTVSKEVDVVDDECGGAVDFRPEAGHVYLLQFSYQGDGVCELTCFEQRPDASGMAQYRCPWIEMSLGEP